MFLAGQTTVDTPYLGPVVISMVLMGLGLAIVQGPATDSIMSSVPLDEAGAGSAVNDTTRELGGTLGVAVIGSIVASYYTSKVAPIVDAIPDAVMSAQEKGFARESVLSVIEIRSRDISPLFEQQKESLILTMKTACLDGFAIASYFTVGAALVTALLVALFLPWKPTTDGSILSSLAPKTPK
jgi:hypothetical protein